MRAFAPFWDSIPNDITRQMLKVPFYDVGQGVQDAKAEAAARSSKLVDDEYRKSHNELVVTKATVTASLHETREDLTCLEKNIRECKIRVEALEVQERSATTAVIASPRRHHSYTANFRTYPYSQGAPHPIVAAPAMMAPPPPRPSAYDEQHTRPTKALPVRRSDPPTTWAAITCRRPLPNTHTRTDDSYLNVRVSSLRHHTTTCRPRRDTLSSHWPLRPPMN